MKQKVPTPCQLTQFFKSINTKKRSKTTATTTVKDYTESHHSKLLGITSPGVNFEQEMKLKREARLTLAQVCFGYSRILNNYLNMIDPKVANICNN